MFNFPLVICSTVEFKIISADNVVNAVKGLIENYKLACLETYPVKIMIRVTELTVHRETYETVGRLEKCKIGCNAYKKEIKRAKKIH